jgi:hypothetical protein
VRACGRAGGHIQQIQVGSLHHRTCAEARLRAQTHRLPRRSSAVLIPSRLARPADDGESLVLSPGVKRRASQPLDGPEPKVGDGSRCWSPKWVAAGWLLGFGEYLY